MSDKNGLILVAVIIALLLALVSAIAVFLAG